VFEVNISMAQLVEAWPCALGLASHLVAHRGAAHRRCCRQRERAGCEPCPDDVLKELLTADRRWPSSTPSGAMITSSAGGYQTPNPFFSFLPFFLLLLVGGAPHAVALCCLH
jgi:hypothetical protein